MSAIKACWIQCDNDCEATSGDGTLGQCDTIGAALRLAVAEGWHRRPGGRHVCPDCWAGGAR